LNKLRTSARRRQYLYYLTLAPSNAVTGTVFGRRPVVTSNVIILASQNSPWQLLESRLFAGRPLDTNPGKPP
jgi:hypothetical protein